MRVEEGDAVDHRYGVQIGHFLDRGGVPAVGDVDAPDGKAALDGGVGGRGGSDGDGEDVVFDFGDTQDGVGVGKGVHERCGCGRDERIDDVDFWAADDGDEERAIACESEVFKPGGVVELVGCADGCCGGCSQEGGDG